MDFNPSRLVTDLEEGRLRETLERELVDGFRQLREAGEAVPPASHFAARITEIIDRQLEQPLSKDESFTLYQEVLLACENARKAVLGEEAEEERARLWQTLKPDPRT